MTRVAVLIVSYRSADEIEQLLATIPAAAGADDVVEVHVVENSDDAAEAERIAAMPGVTRFVRAERNLGYGGGMNLLAQALDDDVDWYLIANPDLRLDDGAIGNLVEAAGRHPEGALFGPRIRDEDGVRYPSARRFPSLRTGVGHALFGRIWPANPWTQRYHHLLDSAAGEQPVDWLSGSCLLARPSAFRQVGGFDEGYFMYFEDVDIALRLRQAGWEAFYSPGASVMHSGGHSTSSQSQLMRRVHHQSARRYINRRYAAWYLAPVRWVLTAGLVVRGAVGRG